MKFSRYIPAEKGTPAFIEFSLSEDDADWVRFVAPEFANYATARNEPSRADQQHHGRWVPLEEHPGKWKEIRVEFDKELTVSQVLRAAGALGYALREHLVGEPLSLPRVALSPDPNVTILEFEYDSTTSKRSDPDFFEAFDAAMDYIEEGSPVRTTDRRGPGTAGTRLVDGIGPVGMRFFVRS